MRHAGGLGGTDQRKDVIFVAVDAAIGQQSHDVQCRAFGLLDGLLQYRVLVEAVFFDIAVDTADVLLDNPTGADIQVTHFRVAELPLGRPTKPSEASITP
jgi:hypothetical protein